MRDHEIVFASHVQHYENSCAASGMELILKLHSLVDLTFRAFQDKYGDANIGFEKLGDLAPYGITAQDHEMPTDAGFEVIRTEVQRGHFPIVSVFSDPVGWHIWVAIPRGDSFRLASRAYGRDRPLEIGDLDYVRDNLKRFRNGRINFVTYDVVLR